MRISDLDINWSAERAHQVVVRQFPQFEGIEPSVLGRGWDNVCIIYADSTVFRLPTRKLGGEIMAIECAVLPQIESQLSLPVPHFQYFGLPDEGYEWQFVGYMLLSGVTSEQLDWNSEERIVAASVLGEFLRGLHQIPISGDLRDVLPPDQMDRASKKGILDRIEKYRGQFDEAFPEQIDWAKGLVDLAFSISEILSFVPKLCVVHGDLYPRHILADEAKQVTGIIDWGDVHCGHPFLDLSIAYSFLDGPERPAFWEAYELPVEDGVKVMARLKAINYALVLYLYGRHSDDARLVKLSEQIARRVQSE